MCNNPVHAVCSVCGESPNACFEGVLDLLEYLVSEGWGQLECGLFVCPCCLKRIARRLDKEQVPA